MTPTVPTAAILALLVQLVLAVHADALDLTTHLSNYPLATWTESNGLSSTYINAITQDREGYLWLGTTTGLVRFDGVNFVRWEPARAPRLPALGVSMLLRTRDESLWLGFVSIGKVSRVRAGSVTNYGPEDGLPEGTITALFEDSDGTLWAGSRLGLSRFRHGKWERVELPSGLSNQPIWQVYEDRHRDLWIATNFGALRRAAGEDVFQPVPSPPYVHAFDEDGQGAMWITTHDQAVTTLRPGSAPAPAPLAPTIRNGMRLLRDRDGNLWIATLGMGVIKVSAGDRNDRPAVVECLTEKNGLTSDVVWALFEDREGNVWVGTQHGLNRLSNSVVIPIPHHDDGVLTQSRPIRVVTASPQEIWVGTNDGLFRFSGQERRRYHLRDGLPNVGIYAMHSDQRGRLWIADEGGGITRLENGSFAPVPLPRGSFFRISALTLDRRGALWIVDMNRGVFRLVDGVLAAPDEPALRRKGGVSAFADSRGRVWIGFVDAGLVVFDGGHAVSYSPREGLTGSTVSAIYEDTRGRIWVGTPEGLNWFHDGRFTALTTKNGFPESDVTAIIQDLEGNLWVGGNAGVIRVNPDDIEKIASVPNYQPAYTLFDVSDGLPGVPIGGGSDPNAARARDGVLWFVTTNGLAALDPRRVGAIGQPPPVHIEDVIVDGREVDPLPRLGLPPRSSRLQIDYTALSFMAPSKTRFRYLLEGFDRDWIDAGTHRQAFYTNLPPGTYRFRVTANTNGVWNRTGASWDFSIRPAFYQTGWFYALCVSCLGLAVYGAWRFRVRRLREQFSAVFAERARMGREIHDTLLQGLIGVSLQVDDLSSKLETSPGSAQHQLERLRKQVVEYIRETRQAIWDLRSPVLETGDLIAALRAAGESITGSHVRFEFDLSGMPRRAGANTEEQLLKIGQEAVANAVRHGQATRVRMELHYGPESVALRIVDDGVGFDPQVADHVRHWGLLGMQERAQQVGGQCRIISRPGHGTEVEAVVPIRVDLRVPA